MNRKKWAAVLLTVILAVVAMGYAVGAYFVDFALKRGNDTDPLAPPAACADIQDKSRMVPPEPAVSKETWSAVSSDGRHLAATHFSPAHPGKRWAILIHGYGRDQHYAGDYAEVYLKHGYQVLTPDLCASGETEGQYITMGGKESEEIAVWTRKIKEQYPDAEIVLHGVSMGAATALMAAARDDIAGVVAVIEDCGYTSAYEMFSNQLGVIFGLPEFPIMNCVDVVSGIKTGVKVSDAAPIKVVDKIKVPVLFIHGEADKLIPPVMMEQLYDACKAKKEKFTVPGAGHGDSMPTDSRKYWSEVFDFLARAADK
ncbi:hypothetical protein D081_2007 [Anaerovibrio sp. JC8]|uniref:alpha/beta hydrolase n=1 Tax=Anaerovibrio sp. JC8 TaxID=1240085 RepID=UPI000A09B25C|nr:alpha/beta hydrolase [Anaerovibrio sp. JC8]ORT99278.1 hypothetical protein D081_2007 [Anaerovibrio sp. JC8]